MANVDSPEKTRRLAQAASSGRSVICRVLLLDGTTYDIDVDKKAVGLVLFDKVCDHLDLLEKDYFGLNFIDPKTSLESWLNLDKKISKQMKDQAWHFNFEIKFYPTDVHQLHEDLTRYQLCLQIRRDIVSEKLPCSFVTYSLLGSYTVQSELGDWEMEEFGPGVDYIKGMRFAPTQDRDLLKKIVELHKTHKGQTPEEAELHFLDNAKKLSLYGVYLHDAKDGEGVDIQLGICASGVMIYKDKLQINRFVWPKVVKMSYRRNKFYIKLRPGEFEDFQSMIAFKLLSIRHSKRLWKIAVEHHSFFRFKESDMPRKRGLLKLGSKFRYSGRTLYQSKMAVSAVDRPMPNFDRIHSKRATYGGRPNKRHEIEDYYSRPTREPRSSDRPPKPEVRNDNYIDRNPEDEPPPARNDPDRSEDEDEDPIDTKHRMEKMHAIPTPLALMNKEREQTENNNGQPRHMEQPEDDRPEPRRERRDDYRREPEEDMERPIDIPPIHEPPHVPPGHDTPFQLLSKEEQKRQHKEEKERIKRAKEEEKRRKKEEEKERKRIEKERKSKKGKEHIGQEWDQAVNTAVRTEVYIPPVEESPERVRTKRMSSFEENKERLRQQINQEVTQSRVGEEFDL
ncbi:band 4.1-like protein 3 isoform X3 [Mytilus californianus]|uniref:band 4.1-like protein 3 isoform X3 n=1 Tax=Mytilus californianus TaxID=6549 RepID=UPI002246D117|nr:band 4.1-like protein 3 isoform X3 [Mytilus californianus]